MAQNQLKLINKCCEEVLIKILHQAMINPFDINEVLEELNETESYKSIDIYDTSLHTSPLAYQKINNNLN